MGMVAMLVRLEYFRSSRPLGALCENLNSAGPDTFRGCLKLLKYERPWSKVK